MSIEDFEDAAEMWNGISENVVVAVYEAASETMPYTTVLNQGVNVDVVGDNRTEHSDALAYFNYNLRKIAIFLTGDSNISINAGDCDIIDRLKVIAHEISERYRN